MLNLPKLPEFRLDKVPFSVVNPSELPLDIAKAFDSYMRGQAAPHMIYVYAHDWDRFCAAVERGDIKIS